MSECVVRMEMPENCQRCELFILCTGKYKNEVVRFDGQNIDKKDRRCLFICQLPEGHGRLGDLDALADDVRSLWEYKTVDGITATTVLKQTLTDIRNCPTIVPAERSET